MCLTPAANSGSANKGYRTRHVIKLQEIGIPFSSPSSVNPLAAIGRDLSAVAQPADLIEEGLSAGPVGGDVAQRAARHPSIASMTASTRKRTQDPRRF